MKKTAILRSLFGSLMVLALVFGMVHLSAEPAEAANRCPATLFGNEFAYVLDTGYICCCIYITPEGEEVVGPSYYC